MVITYNERVSRGPWGKRRDHHDKGGWENVGIKGIFFPLYRDNGFIFLDIDFGVEYSLN